MKTWKEDRLYKHRRGKHTIHTWGRNTEEERHMIACKLGREGEKLVSMSSRASDQYLSFIRIQEQEIMWNPGFHSGQTGLSSSGTRVMNSKALHDDRGEYYWAVAILAEGLSVFGNRDNGGPLETWGLQTGSVMRLKCLWRHLPVNLHTP